MRVDIDPPVGDIGEMRAKAGRLGLECEGLAHRARALAHLVAAMDYECPAADRFRAEVDVERSSLERIIGDLKEVQRRLLREANRVEEAQALCARLARATTDAETAADRGLRDLYCEIRAAARGL